MYPLVAMVQLRGPLAVVSVENLLVLCTLSHIYSDFADMIASLVPRPSHLHANIHPLVIIFTIPKVRRSGWFGDLMVMSHGRGLNIHGHGLNFLDTLRSLPTLSFSSQHFLVCLQLSYERSQSLSEALLIQPGGKARISRDQLVTVTIRGQSDPATSPPVHVHQFTLVFSPLLPVLD